MPFSYSGYGPRQPRHEATQSSARQLQVQRSAGMQPRAIEAELINLSRGGYQLRTHIPLEKGESITVELHDEQSGLGLTLPATVRWVREKRDATWLHGCRLSTQVDWETLGELFLNGILLTDQESG